MKRLLMITAALVALCRPAYATPSCEAWWESTCVNASIDIDDLAALQVYRFQYNGGTEYRFGSAGADAETLGEYELLERPGGVYDGNGINPGNAVFWLLGGMQDFYGKYQADLAAKDGEIAALETAVADLTDRVEQLENQ